MTEIVVLGAGYAGLSMVLKLQDELKGSDTHVTLINKHTYHYQTTWLHKNAVGLYTNQKSMVDIPTLLKPDVVTFKKETVCAIDTDTKSVETDKGTTPYDYLVIALGSEVDTRQIPGLSDHAHSMVTLSQANRLYNRIQTVLSDYKRSKTDTPLHVVVGGGGFTGIELLGELVEELPRLAARYDIEPDKIRLISIETQDTVLPEFDLELGEYAMQKLEQKGVDFKLKSKIRSVSRRTITFDHMGIIEELPAHLFIWTAGVKGSEIIEKSKLPSEAGRVIVNDDLTAPGYPDIYVIGDVALVKKPNAGYFLPNADIAIQKGKYCAKQILARVHNQEVTDAFKFKPYGSQIASLGTKDGIGVNKKGKKFVGKSAAWLKRLTDVVIMFQIGGLKFWKRMNSK